MEENDNARTESPLAAPGWVTAPAGPAVPEPALTVSQPASEPAAVVSEPAVSASEPVPAAPVPEPVPAASPRPEPVPAVPQQVESAPQQVEPAPQPYAVYDLPAAPAFPTPAPTYEQTYGVAAPVQSTSGWGAAPAFGIPPQPAAFDPSRPSGAGTAPQPPTPPMPPTPPAPVYGYEPPASPSSQKRRWPWFLLGLAVGLVIGLGGCAGCVGVMAATSYDDYALNSSPYGHSRDYGYGYGYDYDGRGDSGSETPALPEVPQTPDSSTADTYTIDEITAKLFPEGAPTSAPETGSVCKQGVYTVGATGQIPAGLYFLQGAEDAESNFFVFDAEDDMPGRYELDDSVVYFGNYFVKLEEGDLIAFKPGSDALTMYPAPAASFNPTAPYNDGCYRVGIDIPAGSYTITTYEPSAAVTENECGAYVMRDLDFGSDSIVEKALVIPGGTQVVTVADGQYLELFAATATPATQG